MFSGATTRKIPIGEDSLISFEQAIKVKGLVHLAQWQNKLYYKKLF